MIAAVGAPLDRVDGRLKVTGAATYSAEFAVPQMTYGFLVLSTISNGTVARIDAARAHAAEGVLDVMTLENAPRLATTHAGQRTLMLLQNDRVHYDRQPVAVVIADSFERAKYAASLVDVTYHESAPITRLSEGETYTPKAIFGKAPDTLRGDAAAALAAAAVRVDRVYTTPHENHNPMEPHATIAQWEGERLTVHDASQGIFNARKAIATTFGIPQSDVRVITTFVGGGFGCKGSTWPHTILAAMAAKLVRRPVRIELWRPQMWGSVGYRPATIQRVAIGANAQGVIAATIHETRSQTSAFDEFIEPSGLLTTMLYRSPALRVTHRLTRGNYGTPTFMRAPGESSGSFALESAMDELAYAVQLDPIELRLRNYAETDPGTQQPFSSKSLRECYRAGAAAFGWARRMPQPGSMREGELLVGMGMATATYPMHRSAASAVARLHGDGSVIVQTGGVDLGTGAYTVFTQVAAEALGVDPSAVRVELGDTVYPQAPNAGGSQLTASAGSAVRLAALDARRALIALAVEDAQSPLHGAEPSAIETANGRLFVRAESTRGETFSALLARHGDGAIEGRAEAKPGAEAQQYSMHAFGAQFAEVRVRPESGEVRVVRQIGAFASGRILNAKTARSQYIGGMVFGLGMALLEETRSDARSGRIMNANLADYLLPVHADIGAIDAVIVPEDDPHVNEIGVKGIGEIGIVGAAAAIANAVYHATGKRIRDLPITPERLLA